MWQQMWIQIDSALHASLARVLTKTAILLPAVIAFILAIIVFGLLGLLASYLVRRLLVLCHFDERVQQKGTQNILQWSTSGRAPSVVVAQIVLWANILLGLVIGIVAFGAAYSNSGMAEAQLFPYLTHGVSAALLFIAGTICARFLARSVLIGAVNMNLQYARLLSQGVKWLVMVLTVAMMLERLTIGGVILNLAFGILFGGIVLSLSLAIGLGSKELVSRSLEGEDGRSSTRSPEDTGIRQVRHF